MAQFPQDYALDNLRLAIGRQIYQALATIAKKRVEGSELSVTAVGIARLLEQPPEAHLGDFAFPCFRFAKELKIAPQAIAQDLAQAMAQTPIQGDGRGEPSWIVRMEVVGAFLNIFVDQKRLALLVIPQVLSGVAFVEWQADSWRTQQKVMIEYSQPNTLKEFHVGHVRNVCLGQALVNLFKYCGYQVTGANYYGDDGTHIATVLWYLQRNGLKAPDHGQDEWFGQMYARAKQTVKDAAEDQQKSWQKEISNIHRAVEKREGPFYELWKETRAQSLATFADIYQWLGVHFDIEFFESAMTDEAQAIVDEYYSKGLFILDQGAIGADLNAQKLGFCILRKTDGNTLYATKDLALARRKFESYQIDRSIYVVADEQNRHFKQVFKILDLMGFAQASKCYHLSYGLVMLPEGKMSSRAGTAVTLSQLRRDMTEHLKTILTKYEGEWSEDELSEVTHRLCDGAIKFGMIATDPVKEIVFNLEDWLSFEGHSGPYLMYSYTRTRSILRKANELGARPDGQMVGLLGENTEFGLLRYLYDFNAVVASACESYRPSQVATHLFYMCKAFNRFYAEVSVLKTDDVAMRGARLALVEAFARVLQVGLSLLGMRPPERM